MSQIRTTLGYLSGGVLLVLSCYAAARFGFSATLASGLVTAGVIVAANGLLTAVIVRQERARAREVLRARETEIRAQAEAELEQQRARLREAKQELLHDHKMEAIGRLAGGVAHDFNNLLTIILGFADMLVDSVPPPARDDVLLIRQAAERASLLTKQLLTFSRRQPWQPKVLDLNGVVAASEQMLRRLMGEDIRVAISLAPDLGLIEADPTQLTQVLLNLAANGRDAMPEGGVFRIGTMNVFLSQAEARGLGLAPGRYTELTVSDTGAGMDELTRAHIFEPFFTTKGVGKGTGLGLATVYGIMQQSGGTVTAESAPGEGATFRLYFPWAQRVAHESRPAAAMRAGPGGQEHVLLVEDDPWVRDYAGRILRSSGYRTVEVSSPEQALEYLLAGPRAIDLLVTDIVMPEMNGRELADAARRIHPDLPVLMISGFSTETLSERGVLVARTGFLQKPFTADRLLGKLREVLDPAREEDGRTAVEPQPGGTPAARADLRP